MVRRGGRRGVFSFAEEVTMYIRGNLGQEPAASTGLGLEVDPTFLAVGIGVALLAMFLLGGKTEPARRKRKRAQVQKQLTELRKQLAALD